MQPTLEQVLSLLANPNRDYACYAESYFNWGNQPRGEMVRTLFDFIEREQNYKLLDRHLWQHCLLNTDQADYLSPLVAWVERGLVPGAIQAQARGPGNVGGVNADLPTTWAPDRTRPLCPYPSVARYDGSGDVERASNWRCTAGGGHGHHDD